MKTKLCPGLLLFIALTLAAFTATAQTFYYKANNSTALNSAGSWTNNALPTGSDWVVWDTNVATVANCTNENLGGTTSWGGIQILNPPSAITVTNTAKTLTLGSLGIDMSEANSTADLFLVCPVTTSGAQSWNVGAGRTLTFAIGTGSSVIVGGDLAINGRVRFNSKDFRVGAATLSLTNPATTLDFSAGLESFSVGYAGNCTVNQTAGTVNLFKGSTSTGAMLVGANGAFIGTYNLNGGSIVDTNTTADYISVGDSSGSTGNFNVNGGTVTVPQFQVGNNGYGYVNVTNGSITTLNSPGNDFVVNKGGNSLSGFLNVYGGTVSINGYNLLVGKAGVGGSQAAVYLASPGVINVGSSVQIPGGSANPGIVTIDSGSMNVTNNVTLLSSGAGSGTVNLNGGTLTANSVTVGAGTGVGAFNFNGGTLQARANNGSFVAAAVPAYVLTGGAVINNAGFSITVAAPLINGTAGAPDGGLLSLGAGTLTLTGNSSYNGVTTVGAGVLSVGTTNLAGGPILPGSATIAVTNGTLDTMLSTNDSTLVCSNLSFGGSGGTVLAQFDCGTNSNPSVPLISATNNLSVRGTVTVNVFGSGLSVGVIPLIQYAGSITGGGSFSLALVQGASGYVTNNTTAKQVQLVVTGAAVLDWRALVNTNWDTATLNWFDLNNLVPAAFSGGATVYFDDSTSNALVNVAGSVLPGVMTINNTASNYVFGGTGSIGGTGSLAKFGTGTVTMSLTNSYSGATVISNGLFRLGTNNAIPAASDLTVEGKLDLAGFSTGAHSLNGNNGLVDNSGATAAVLTLGGNGGTFAGHLTNSGASLALNKGGANLTLLAAVNGYSGGTTSGGGLLQLASEHSIGTGPLTLDGGTLAWTDTNPHTLTNVMTIGGGVTLGSPTNANGLLTVTRVVDLLGGGRGLTCNEDTLLAGGTTDGSINGKSGPNTLTLQNTVADWNGGSLSVNGGVLVLVNSTITQDGSNVRIQCSSNDTARLVITNGSTLVMNGSATSNFRFGDSATGGTDATNIVDIYGSLILMPVSGPSSSGNNKFQMGSTTDPSGQNIANLLPGGVLETKQVLDLSPSSTSTFNFNGGTLKVSTNDNAATFMNGLDNAFVLDGGATIDTAVYSVSIGQALQSGGTGIGGLTKQGLGTLYLNGGNSYTGPTLVAAGGLGGGGTITSPVTVASGASLLAGPSTTVIGSFNINSTVTFNGGGKAVMKITKISGSPNSDNLAGISTLQYSGTLVVVTNVDMNDVFAAGDSVTLFSAAGYTGSFSSYSLPPLAPGLGWDVSHLNSDGSLRVMTVAVPAPVFNPPVFAGASVVLSGTGGTAWGEYRVLTTADVSQPLASWTVAATGSFDGSGNFNITNAVVPANPAQFYSISVP